MLPWTMRQYWKTYGRYDAAVVGAGSAGVGAAIAAARRGLRVVLLESYGFAGGVAAKSCVTHFHSLGLHGRQMTGGLIAEVVRRLDAMGETSFMLDNLDATPEYAPIGGRELNAKADFRTETVKLLYRRMLEEAGVECLFYTHVTDALTENGSVKALLVSMLEGPRLIEADTFIDCTGDALVSAAADEESVEKFPDDVTMHKSMFFFVDGVTPFDPEYNKALYKKLFDEGKVPGNVWNHFGYSLNLNPGVCQIAICYAVGDGVRSADMSRMDGELRENVFRVVEFLREYMPGFRDCRLIESSVHVGVRGGQAIRGVDRITDETVFGEDRHDCVALTSRQIGAHQNKLSKNFTSDWGRLEDGFGSIPMGALVSARLENLLAAGRCVSAEGHLLGTYRMMATCMATGEAAGLIAYLAKTNGTGVRRVTYAELLPLLRENGFILE